MVFKLYSLAVLSILVLVQAVRAEVVINEIRASSSEYLLQWVDGVPRLGTGTPWMALDYDDSAWIRRQAMLGFGVEDLNTDLEIELKGITPSLYVRKRFSIPDDVMRLDASLSLTIEYDDGFVAYLNGNEILRANLGGKHAFVYCGQEAYNAHAGRSGERLELGILNDHLVAGENVLAIQIHNKGLMSAMKFDAVLAYREDSVSGQLDQILVDKEETWATFIGLIEPSGGLYDPGLLTRDDWQPKFCDWIELLNRGDLAVDLSGWTMRDGSDGLPWSFPDGVSIGPGEYLVVIADGLGNAPEVGESAEFLHTNFSLSGDGEYLGLANDSGVVQSEFVDGYPKQSYFHSFGIEPEGTAYAYLGEPTPGATNVGPVFSGIVKKPKFSQAGGFHDEAINLTLWSDTPNALIRYTVDGSEPTDSNGVDYSGPIFIDRIAENIGTVIRARAFKSNCIPSLVRTRTFLIGQHESIRTIPAVVITGDAHRSIFKPHGVTSIVGGHREFIQGPQPVWFPDTVDDYNIPMLEGRAGERPASLEMRYPDGRSGFQINMGIRIAGSPHTRERYQFSTLDLIPWESTFTGPVLPGFTQKPSFNFVFRSQYDNESSLVHPVFPGSAVTEFKSLRLRAGKGDVTNPFLLDEFSRRLHIALGSVGSHGILTTAYVNGEFKGYFNLVERYKESFFQKWYNSSNGWDIRDRFEFKEGDSVVYDQLIDFLDIAPGSLLEPLVDLTTKENYDRLSSFIDIEHFIDYLLFHVWAASSDWPQNNYILARERVPEAKFRFYVWDAETTMGRNPNFDVSNNVFENRLVKPNAVGVVDQPITQLWKALVKSPEFRLHFADRIHKHFKHSDSAFKKENLEELYQNLRDEFLPIFEYVRPGEAFNDAMISEWINQREDYLFDTGKHFENAGVWPDVDIPNFGQLGGNVPHGFELSIGVRDNIFFPFAGKIYYTIGGKDPREFGGVVSSSAIEHQNNHTITLNESAKVKARVLSESGEWGALVEAEFLVGIMADAGNLVITEIMYRPEGPSLSEQQAGFLTRSEFEFIELMNVSEDRIELEGVRIASGIDFEFADDQFLMPGTRILVVSNISAFKFRYGQDERIAGEFDGKLSNRGEQVQLVGAFGNTFLDFNYEDRSPWPTGPDGNGYSLVLIDPAVGSDLLNPKSWRTSSLVGGSPGVEDKVSVDQLKSVYFSESEMLDSSVSGDFVDLDKDGLVNLLEIALASDPRNEDSVRLPTPEIIEMEVDEISKYYIALRFSCWPGATQLSYHVEASDDLVNWVDLDENNLLVDSIDNGNGSLIWIVRDSVDINSIDKRYMRLRVLSE